MNHWATLIAPLNDRPCTPAPHYPTVFNPWHLSPAQCEIFRLLSEGLAHAEVSEALELDNRTVAAQIRRAREKMKANTTMHALLMWDRHFNRGDA